MEFHSVQIANIKYSRSVGQEQNFYDNYLLLKVYLNFFEFSFSLNHSELFISNECFLNKSVASCVYRSVFDSNLSLQQFNRRLHCMQPKHHNEVSNVGHCKEWWQYVAILCLNRRFHFYLLLDWRSRHKNKNENFKG